MFLTLVEKCGLKFLFVPLFITKMLLTDCPFSYSGVKGQTLEDVVHLGGQGQSHRTVEVESHQALPVVRGQGHEVTGEGKIT